NLMVGYYDEDTGQWVMLDPANVKIDPATNSVTAEISHFTVFSVIAHTAPAKFTISNLTISPTTIEVAEQATISAVVANSGDLSGNTKVTLKINGVTIGSQLIKIASHESTKVSFLTVQGEPGSYKVDIDGLSGTFTVKAVPVKPVVITSTVPSITVPPVEYPAPTAPAPPAVPAPVPAPMPWLPIIISLVATIIVAVILIWNYGFRSQY
ncbi:MAG: CARDB domain-containing protein, partial [Dehalococcoidales bacterium]